jgi:hypothetical protein
MLIQAGTDRRSLARRTRLESHCAADREVQATGLHAKQTRRAVQTERLGTFLLPDRQTRGGLEVTFVGPSLAMNSDATHRALTRHFCSGKWWGANAELLRFLMAGEL